MTEALVATIGGPGVGKATLAGALAECLSGSVFRLRRYAREHGAEPFPGDATSDPRGEYADHVVDQLLHDAFLHGGFADMGGGPVFLLDVPANPVQLGLVHNVARLRHRSLRVLELDVMVARAASRCLGRRLCLSCVPDPDGAPHEVAPVEVGMPTVCVACGGLLSVRTADRVRILAARIARYRTVRHELRSAARAARIPWQQVWTEGEQSAVLSTALRLLAVPAEEILTVEDVAPDDEVPLQRTVPPDVTAGP
jgi:adenylate kinase family enzyme